MNISNIKIFSGTALCLLLLFGTLRAEKTYNADSGIKAEIDNEHIALMKAIWDGNVDALNVLIAVGVGHQRQKIWWIYGSDGGGRKW